MFNGNIQLGDIQKHDTPNHVLMLRIVMLSCSEYKLYSALLRNIVKS